MIGWYCWIWSECLTACDRFSYMRLFTNFNNLILIHLEILKVLKLSIFDHTFQMLMNNYVRLLIWWVSFVIMFIYIMLTECEYELIYMDKVTFFINLSILEYSLMPRENILNRYCALHLFLSMFHFPTTSQLSASLCWSNTSSQHIKSIRVCVCYDRKYEKVN